VAEAITRDELNFSRLVATRTINEPQLLTLPSESDHLGWLTLWQVHVLEGGKPWGTLDEKLSIGRMLLDAVIINARFTDSLKRLAPQLGDAVVKHSKRQDLWRSVDAATIAALLPSAANSLICLCGQEYNVPCPESPLASAVIDILNAAKVPERALINVLGWNINHRESDVVAWLSKNDWSNSIAEVGSIVANRRWTHVANDIYRRYKRESTSLAPAVEKLRHLLPWWDNWMFSVRTTGYHKTTDWQTSIAQRTAELGADLAPDRLEDIWVRAGGERKRLASLGTPDSRWRDATNLAQRGALQEGILALILVLEADFPYNRELLELKEAFSISR
jgi:hypothetical protein